MHIALSSAADPQAALAELVEGCTRRGLAALHLVAGHGHGIDLTISDAALDEAVQVADAAGVRVVSYQLDDTDELRVQAALRICGRFNALLVMPAASAAAPNVTAGSVMLHAARENVSDAATRCFAEREDIQHITLCGGGPEAAQFEGRGIGSLMARFALMGYHGVLALAPSSRAVVPVWRTWLQRGRNWGCGSKAADASLVQLN